MPFIRISAGNLAVEFGIYRKDSFSVYWGEGGRSGIREGIEGGGGGGGGCGKVVVVECKGLFRFSALE